MRFIRHNSFVAPKWRTFMTASLLTLAGILYLRSMSNPGTWMLPLLPGGSPPSQGLVVASLASEDTRWVTKHFPSLGAFIYIVDDAHAKLTTPMNKGNEAMVYLTYIVDHYDRLHDVTIFAHAHSGAEHNEDLMGGSMIHTLQRLRVDYVVQEGYFNLRCNWEPGCPESLDLYKPVSNSSEQEAKMKEVWQRLHPGRPLPAALAQPCCGQFAASRARIRSVPLQTWIHFRDWLIETELDDYHSGRVWEYNWQFVLAGKAVFCPPMDTCYCKAYGICFGPRDSFDAYWTARTAVGQASRDYLAVKAAGSEDWPMRQRIEDENHRLRKVLEEAKMYH